MPKEENYAIKYGYNFDAFKEDVLDKISDNDEKQKVLIKAIADYDQKPQSDDIYLEAMERLGLPTEMKYLGGFKRFRQKCVIELEKVQKIAELERVQRELENSESLRQKYSIGWISTKNELVFLCKMLIKCGFLSYNHEKDVYNFFSEALGVSLSNYRQQMYNTKIQDMPKFIKKVKEFIENWDQMEFEDN